MKLPSETALLSNCSPLLLLLITIHGIPLSRDRETQDNANGFSNLNQLDLTKVCTHNNGVYQEGENFTTSNPCETCVCRPPGFSCSLLHCDSNPGCRAVHTASKCCPEYLCDCEKNGKIYVNGGRVEEPGQNPCEACFCRGGVIQCVGVNCYTRKDCEPKFLPGQCCPKYDHCPPLESMKENTTSLKPGNELRLESEENNKRIKPPESTTAPQAVATLEIIEIHPGLLSTPSPPVVPEIILRYEPIIPSSAPTTERETTTREEEEAFQSVDSNDINIARLENNTKDIGLETTTVIEQEEETDTTDLQLTTTVNNETDTTTIEELTNLQLDSDNTTVDTNNTGRNRIDFVILETNTNTEAPTTNTETTSEEATTLDTDNTTLDTTYTDGKMIDFMIIETTTNNESTTATTTNEDGTTPTPDTDNTTKDTTNTDGKRIGFVILDTTSDSPVETETELYGETLSTTESIPDSPTTNSSGRNFEEINEYNETETLLTTQTAPFESETPTDYETLSTVSELLAVMDEGINFTELGEIMQKWSTTEMNQGSSTQDSTIWSRKNGELNEKSAVVKEEGGITSTTADIEEKPTEEDEKTGANDHTGIETTTAYYLIECGGEELEINTTNVNPGDDDDGKEPTTRDIEGRFLRIGTPEKIIPEPTTGDWVEEVSTSQVPFETTSNLGQIIRESFENETDFENITDSSEATETVNPKPKSEPPVLLFNSDQLRYLQVGEEQPMYINAPQEADVVEEKRKEPAEVIIVPTTTPMTVQMVKVVDGGAEATSSQASSEAEPPWITPPSLSSTSFTSDHSFPSSNVNNTKER